MRVIAALMSERQWRNGDVLRAVLFGVVGLILLAVYVSGRRS